MINFKIFADIITVLEIIKNINRLKIKYLINYLNFILTSFILV